MKTTFKVQSFRKLPNPYTQSDGAENIPQMYVALCDVTNLPVDFPMETNPRDQNLNTGVARAIHESLKAEAKNSFYLLNRGILLSAKNVSFENNKNEMTIIFEDTEFHGNVDGGHTYRIIKELKEKITPGTQFVKIEILTGVEDIFTELAAARNTSVQVQSKSIAELEDRFEIIKSVLEGDQGLFDRIIYKQNAKGDVDISEILQILNLFNIDEYPTTQTESVAIQSYSSKSKCTERYITLHKKHGENSDNPYVKMKPIMLDIFKLYNKLETKIGDYYKERNPNPNAKYGSVKGVSGTKGKGGFKSKFYQQIMDFSSPVAFLYPILGAFRAMVIEKDGFYEWRENPLEMMDKVGPELVNTTIERSRTLGSNPNAVGKDSGNWKTLYMIVKFNLSS
ncbi:MAG: AIPR family protein [Oscillospiraceae bacterium]|nr:AIPR family protein [Oscillospiraceae bacterium]